MSRIWEKLSRPISGSRIESAPRDRKNKTAGGVAI